MKSNVVHLRADRGALQLSRSYNFTDKLEAVDELRTMIQDNHVTLIYTATKSGVCIGTLRRWFGGKTQRPQLPTLNAVARVFGKRLGLVDK